METGAAGAAGRGDGESAGGESTDGKSADKGSAGGEFSGDAV
ncbi:hypothetical protein [Streptomyces sp. PKU-MA01144]|nr:hypothetical protein [Streptomyces sp. PKU-MA01144]